MKFFPTQESFTYGGLGNPPFKKAKAVILPIPYEGTITYGSGASCGPAAIIDASRHMETYDLELGCDFFERLGIYTFEPMEPDLSSPAAMMQRIEKAISQLASLKKFPVILGGEHSITTGSVRAFKKRYKDLTVVQLDAHADLRGAYQGTKYSHACTMRRCREITDVVQVGIRSMSAEEADFIKNNNLKTIFYGPDLPTKQILKHIGKNVYLTIDLDVLNPALMPSVGTPEPGGLIWYPFLTFIKELFKQRKVVGADVVELAPLPGVMAPNFMAAVITYKLIGYKFVLKRK